MKKFITFVLAVCLSATCAFSLTACGGTSGTGGTSGGTNNSTSGGSNNGAGGNQGDTSGGETGGKITPIAVTAVELNVTEKTLTVDDTFTLIATVKPANAENKTILWSSSDGNVATVSYKGLVTAVAPGTADITVKSSSDESKTAVCRVTVNPKPVPATGMTLNKTFLKLWVDEEYQLEPVFSPEYSIKREVEWSSEDPEVVTVDENGRVKVLKKRNTGEDVAVTATTKDGEFSTTCSIRTLTPVTEIKFTDENSSVELPLGSYIDVPFSAEGDLKYEFNIASYKIEFDEHLVVTEGEDLVDVFCSGMGSWGGQLGITAKGKLGTAKIALVNNKENPTVKAEITVTIVNPYLTVGQKDGATRYANVQEAIDATTETNNTVYLHGSFTVNETINVSKGYDITIFGNDYNGCYVYAGDDFASENLVSISGSGNVKIGNIFFIANKKCRVMKIDTDKTVELMYMAIEDGFIDNDVDVAPGLLITGKANVVMTNCTIEDNAYADETLEETNPVRYYSTDVWAGSQTTVTLEDGCWVDCMVKNADYNGSESSMVIFDNGKNGRILHLYLQYDEFYGTENSIAAKGTGVAGAVLKLVSGKIRNLHIAGSDNNITDFEAPEAGYIYQSGKDKTEIA